MWAPSSGGVGNRCAGRVDRTTSTAAPAATASDGGASKGSVTGAYVVGGLGLLAGLAALALAVTGRRRRAGRDQPDRVSTGV
jgi:hypothetical protein